MAENLVKLTLEQQRALPPGFSTDYAQKIDSDVVVTGTIAGQASTVIFGRNTVEVYGRKGWEPVDRASW